MSPEPSSPFAISRPALLAIFFGALLRFFALWQTCIINTDATFYIQQAKAFYHGLPDLITAGYPYLTNYSIAIAGAFPLFGDWETAAMSVSCFFACLGLIPLYWLIRRFFSENVAVLALLTFALSPPFINASRDVIRGPLCWPFLLLGIHLFLLGIEGKGRWHYLFSALSFLFAAWARIEVVGIAAASAFFLLLPLPVNRGRKRWEGLLFFLCPILLLGIVGIINLHLLRPGGIDLLFSERILERLSGLAGRYHEIRDTLSRLIEAQDPAGIQRYFFEKVRNLVWFIGLGVILVQVVRAFYLPFFALFILGLYEARRDIRRDDRLIYLLFLCTTALLILYVQVFHLWAMYNRWIVLFLFPAYPFVGYGIYALLRKIRGFFSAESKAPYALVAALILFVTLPKIARYDDRAEKMVFKEIGAYISRFEEKNSPSEDLFRIGAGIKELILIDFYAKEESRSALPFDRETLISPEKMRDAETLKRFDYFILNSQPFEQPAHEWQRLRKAAGFVRLKVWDSPSEGRLILYHRENR